MSVGAGIIWSTLIVLLAIAIWRTTVNKKWKSVGTAVAVILGLCALIVAVYWGWQKYEDRPQVATNLAGVSLGERAVDVTLALGKPSLRLVSGNSKKPIDSAYAYQKSYDPDYLLFVGFDGQPERRVIQICEGRGNSRLLGIGHYSSEESVLKKLGQPSETSIHEDGLRKLISYAQWKSIFEIEKGLVTRVCVSDDGVIRFEEEMIFDPHKRFDPTTAKPVRRPDNAPGTPDAADDRPWKDIQAEEDR